MSHKLGICIPYRNRKEHVERLIPHLSKHLNDRGIDHKFYIGHQVDDKLFNRGAMKNIAAHYAFNDGCDYIAWHDVDMLPLEDADYSYPEKYPIHIATKLSKYNYGLGYDQYFGGVILFTKEQVEKTNGYSNDYWDWGQEDDDLFWRCHYEGYSKSKTFKSYKNKTIAVFNGVDSVIKLPTNREISSCLSNDHTIQILFMAEQQPDKVPIWLVGDENGQFVEYPLLRKEGMWTWGLSFNNSRSVNLVLFDRDSQHHYTWAKKFELEWTWVTMSFNSETKEVYFFVNDELVTNYRGIKENIPFPVGKDLRPHDAVKPFTIGYCDHTGMYYKGLISEVKILNKFFDNIEDVFKSDDLVLHLDFEDGVVNKSNGVEGKNINTDIKNIDFDVVENIIPQRIEGRFDCMFHVDEGYVNGKWAKGETTARNERRFVTEMQQRKINYKTEGINKILDVTEVVSLDETTYPNTMIINTIMK
jgi:hypothetical protein